MVEAGMQERMEFFPRSLGKRSTLASPLKNKILLTSFYTSVSIEI
jgi:predicted NodU family carbamoyl transferase